MPGYGQRMRERGAESTSQPVDDGSVTSDNSSTRSDSASAAFGGSTATSGGAAVAPGAAGDEALAGYDEERPARALSGWVLRAVDVAAASIAVFSLYQVFFPLAAGRQYALMLFVASVLPLVFLCYRVTARRRNTDRPDNPGPADWVLAATALVVALYPVLTGYDAFLDRQGLLNPADLLAGGVLLVLVLVLEACRRTTGWVLRALDDAGRVGGGGGLGRGHRGLAGRQRRDGGARVLPARRATSAVFRARHDHFRLCAAGVRCNDPPRDPRGADRTFGRSGRGSR